MFIQDTKINKRDYVELGLSCADVCRALDRGLNGGGTVELSQPVLEAIDQLMGYVEPVTHTIAFRLPGLPS